MGYLGASWAILPPTRQHRLGNARGHPRPPPPPPDTQTTLVLNLRAAMEESRNGNESEAHMAVPHGRPTWEKAKLHGSSALPLPQTPIVLHA